MSIILNNFNYSDEYVSLLPFVSTDTAIMSGRLEYQPNFHYDLLRLVDYSPLDQRVRR